MLGFIACGTALQIRRSVSMGAYFILNVVRVIDRLDIAKSDILYATDLPLPFLMEAVSQ